MTSTPPAREPDRWDDPIDFGRLVHAVWRRRWAVLALSVLGAAAGLGLSLVNSRYVSEGVILIPDFTLEQFKRYESALANELRLLEFLQHAGTASNAAAPLIREAMARPEQMADAIRPEFTYTERDAKLFGVRLEDKNALVGIRLRLSQRERVKEAPLRTLAEYVRDTAIKVDLDEALVQRCTEQGTRELELRNLQLDGEFQVRQQEDKAATLRKIIERTPETVIDNRQVVSLARGGERFLSPTAQLVAAEVQIADYQLEQKARERELVAAALRRDYYCKARVLLNRSGTGRQFLKDVEALKAEVLVNADRARDIVEFTANAFDVERQKWTNHYIERMRLVASPEGAQVLVRKPGRTLGVLLGGILGLVAGILAALAQGWLRTHREVVFAKD